MPKSLFLTSLDELRAAAPAWDDLWERSDCTSPLARAEMVAHWIEHFAPNNRLRVAVVEQGGRWLAALPLMEGRAGGVLRAGVLPCNAWPSGATLLWDVAALPEERSSFQGLKLDRISNRLTARGNDRNQFRSTMRDEVGRLLTAALGQLPWQLVSLEAAMPARASWRTLHLALTSAGVPCDLRTRWRVGRLAVQHDWTAAFARLSRKHRQRIASARRKLSARGEVSFEFHKRLAADNVDSVFQRALALEDRGWKGKAGTSVLRMPGAAEFMLRQARCLAAQDRLWLAFLRCGERDIAFCYGVFAKGVLHSFKIGYEIDFAAHSPGHLLHYHLLQAIHADHSVEAIDYIGELTGYHASWRPESYPFARLAFAPRGKLLGQAALWSYQFWRKLRINSTSPTGLPTRWAISAGTKP
jgi:CelD/BcsL family acetyltransferase involved in cellulose biosynthesis